MTDRSGAYDRSVKWVITRVCAKILVESDFYTADMEKKSLIDWLMLAGSSEEKQ